VAAGNGAEIYRLISNRSKMAREGGGGDGGMSHVGAGDPIVVKANTDSEPKKGGCCNN